MRGEIVFSHDNVDDFVMLRGDGSPTYHLASTVDDVDYHITHVIRGEDILPSTPKHILITEAMGGERTEYAHLSLLNGPDGKKLSKRHGDTALRAYRDAGFLPTAVRNFLVILGWSPGDDEEIVSIEEMIERFDLGSVSRNPAVFDVTKLEWMNGHYLRAMPPVEFTAMALPIVESDLGRTLTSDERQAFGAVAPLVQERAKRLTEITPQVRFLIGDEVTYEAASWDKVMKTAEATTALDGASAALRSGRRLVGRRDRDGAARHAGADKPLRGQGSAAGQSGHHRINCQPTTVRVTRRPGKEANAAKDQWGAPEERYQITDVRSQESGNPDLVFQI